MPHLNWDAFAKLAGGPQQNFEDLCRSLIRLQFARYGDFRRLANQPGVEFHLRLRETCAIGQAGEWHGWQCRWYDLSADRALGTTRRKKIVDAIKKSERELPELTHWTLWTRHILKKDDQKWFYAISTKLKLQLHSVAEVETYMGGAAELLRGSYFGELVLTRADLVTRHNESVAPILPRWLRDVHQQLDVELKLRRMLGESGSWAELLEVADRLSAIAVDLAKETGMPERLRTITADFLAIVLRSVQTLREAHAALASGDFDLLREVLKNAPPYPPWSVRSVPGAFRAVRRLIALRLTNSVEDLIQAQALCQEINELVDVRMIAVTADAGSGKTQLAAELTKESPDRPAGVLLHGRQLHRGQTVDDLARKLTIHGRPMVSIEALVAALDAAGQRERRRLPLVIDGLNEAEHPADWKDPLASLNTTLERYPNVLVVLTLRTGFRKRPERHFGFDPEPIEVTPRTLFSDLAVPDGVRSFELEGFGELTREAVRSYFQHFRILAEPDLPYHFLSHPLTLRMFCEVTNPKRDKDVGFESMPRSLTVLFERYVEEVAKRVAQLAAAAHAYSAEDVRRVFYKMGELLWTQYARGLDERELRVALDDEKRSWKTSIIHMLEHEGVILRNAGATPGEHLVVPVYDAFGGYLVGDYLVRWLGFSGFTNWIAKPETLGLLNEGGAESHPFAGDIFSALVGLVPRAFSGQQFWTFLKGGMQDEALRLAIEEGTRLDTKTIEAIAGLIRSPTARTQIFDDLTEVATAPGHPLNAVFLDEELRKMSVAERDLRWTEWIRQQQRVGLYDRPNHYTDLGKDWKNSTVRSTSDHLRARWTMWALTSTSHELRYRATRALYWYGCHAPDQLFELCFSSLEINDPYVPERMLAASYGVAMALYVSPGRAARKASVLRFARGIYERMFAPPAPPRGTTHSLTREYARRTLQLATVWDKKAFTAVERKAARPPYSIGGLREWHEIAPEKAEIYGPASPLGFNFRNYSIGRLVATGRTDDSDNPEYKLVRNQLLWRVEQLGWTAKRFEVIDQGIANDRFRPSSDPFKTDRYGKKYSRIAYFELDGLRHDLGILKRRRPTERPNGTDLDPTFPTPSPEEKLVTEDFLGSGAAADWLKHGKIDLTAYLRLKEVAGEKGPWVLLDGIFHQEDLARGRRLVCKVHTLILPTRDRDPFIAAIKQRVNPALYPVDRPQAMIAFAGEIPWCDTFPKNGFTEVAIELERKTVPEQRTEKKLFRRGQQLGVREHIELIERMQAHPKGKYPPDLNAELAQLEVREIPYTVERIQSKSAKFQVLVPVCDYELEEPSLEGEVNRPTLAKELATALKLRWIPGTIDLATRQGERTTLGIAHRSRSLYNRQQFFFIREAALKRYLRERKQSLVFVTFGERQLVAHEAAKASGYDERFAGFQAIETLECI